MNKKSILLVLAGLLLTGCASSIPPAITNAPDGAPDLATLRMAPDKFQGQTVRFGGRIVRVENHQKDSWISIVGLPLQSNGKPQLSDQSPGRFIAQVKGFIDPAVYSKNRRVTVVGRFAKMQSKKIGGYSYQYPLLIADDIYLWPRRPKVQYTPAYPLWPYGPWYAPYDYYPYLHYYPRGKLICKTKACS
jgi:outer membrane lipoprotein